MTPRRFGYIAGLLAWLFLLIAVVYLLPSCGSTGSYTPPGAPFVEISCDESADRDRCVVLVYGATSVEAFYNGRLAWWDRDITSDRRLTYSDGPPPVLFAVEACNAEECTLDSLDLR